jgi:stress-induced morphogen
MCTTDSSNVVQPNFEMKSVVANHRDMLQQVLHGMINHMHCILLYAMHSMFLARES